MRTAFRIPTRPGRRDRGGGSVQVPGTLSVMRLSGDHHRLGLLATAFSMRLLVFFDRP